MQFPPAGQWVDVESTCLSRVRLSGRDLDVQFRETGRLYRYRGAGPLYRTILLAPSKGVAFNRLVKTTYPVEPLS